MQKILTVLFCVFVVAGCVTAERSDFEIDSVATANAPWVVGEIVYREEIKAGVLSAEDFFVLRVFQGITVKGYVLVQSFFENGVVAGDPYLIVDEANVLIEHPIMHGPLRAWTPDGKVMTCLMDHGTSIGPCQYRYENGEKLAEITMVDGKPYGNSTSWYPTGEKRFECIIFNNTGSCIEWHESGAKKAEFELDSGKLIGVARTWDEAGNFIMEVRYSINETDVDRVVLYYSSGEKKAEGFGQRGRLVGLWRFWDEEGNLISERDHGSGR